MTQAPTGTPHQAGPEIPPYPMTRARHCPLDPPPAQQALQAQAPAAVCPAQAITVAE